MTGAVAIPAPGTVPGPAAGLLAGLIDYAGVFPPAALSLPAAYAAYRAVQGGPSAWLVGPLLIRASQLAGLAALLEADDRDGPGGPGGADGADGAHESEEAEQAGPTGRRPLPVGVILDGLAPDAPSAPGARPATDSWSDSLASALRRLRPWPSDARLVQVELAVPDGAGVADLESALARAPLEGRPALYLEAAGGAPLAHQAGRLADWGPRLALHAELRLKVRTGGGAQGIPSAAALAGFLVACAAAAVPCKATAGLHRPHPHRGEDTPGLQHGFLNLLGAASLAAAGATAPRVAAALEAPDGPTLGRALETHGPPASPAATRHLLRSFGSCSVAEPLEGLVELGLCRADGTLAGERLW